MESNRVDIMKNVICIMTTFIVAPSLLNKDSLCVLSLVDQNPHNYMVIII